jgi:hypothetical protein
MRRCRLQRAPVSRRSQTSFTRPIFLRRWTNNQDDRNRPALAKAFAACRVFNAKLVISRLDRLSRDAHFLLGLEQAGVEFVACDIPHQTGSQSGSWLWSLRKSARRSPKGPRPLSLPPKARGVRLGAPKGTKVRGSEVGRLRGAKATAANAKAFAERMRGVFDELADLSASAAARELERRGYATPRGGKWSAIHVIRIRARLEASS